MSTDGSSSSSASVIFKVRCVAIKSSSLDSSSPETAASSSMKWFFLRVFVLFPFFLIFYRISSQFRKKIRTENQIFSKIINFTVIVGHVAKESRDALGEFVGCWFR